MKNNRTFFHKLLGTYKKKLSNINKIRFIRDSINDETNGDYNETRLRELFMKYPFINTIHTTNPSIGFRLSVKCNSGYEYSEWGDDAFHRLNKTIYSKYLEGKII